MQLLWKIWFYYKGEISTQTNLETEILPDGTLDLPNRGVALIQIIRRDSSGTRWCMEFGRNFYCKVGDEWWAMTEMGLLNYLSDYLGTAAVLRGAMVPNDLWKEIYQKATLDPEILAITKNHFVRDPLRE